VRPDVVPAGREHVGGEHVVLPSPDHRRGQAQRTEPGLEPGEPLGREVRRAPERDRAGPDPGQGALVGIRKHRRVRGQRVLGEAGPVHDREVHAAAGHRRVPTEQVGADQRCVHQPPGQHPLVELGGRVRPGPGGHHRDRGGAVRAGQQRAQPGGAAPVVTAERDAVQVELIEQRDDVGGVVVQRVHARVLWFLRQTEADLVGHHYSVAGVEQRGKGVPPEVAPGGVAVYQEHRRRVPRPLVDVVHPPGVDRDEA
jgi:hypothetical protein